MNKSGLHKRSPVRPAGGHGRAAVHGRGHHEKGSRPFSGDSHAEPIGESAGREQGRTKEQGMAEAGIQVSEALWIGGRSERKLFMQSAQPIVESGIDRRI